MPKWQAKQFIRRINRTGRFPVCQHWRPRMTFRRFIRKLGYVRISY